MKVRLLVLIIMLGNVVGLTGQSLMLFGGLNNNRFFDYKKDNANFSTFYSGLKGSNFGIGLDNVKIANHSFLFTLRSSSYNGYVYTTARKPEEITTTGIEINKSILGLGIYPFNFKIKDNHLTFSLGVETNFLLNAQMKGYKNTVFSADKPDVNTRIDNSSRNMLNKFGMGLSGRLAYRIAIKKDWWIMPQYAFYCGLTNELKNVGANTKTYRHLIEIGLVRNLFSK
ncbi:MAG: hypothetical protein PSX81_00245 [bacterium]|nr:hypothetical protein [bacterium]